MTIKHLQHYLIRAKNIEVSKKFYTEVLGLNVGYRPPFKFQDTGYMQIIYLSFI